MSGLGYAYANLTIEGISNIAPRPVAQMRVAAPCSGHACGGRGKPLVPAPFDAMPFMARYARIFADPGLFRRANSAPIPRVVHALRMKSPFRVAVVPKQIGQKGQKERSYYYSVHKNTKKQSDTSND